MYRKFLVLAAVFAAFVFTVQAADAGQQKKIDPKIDATSFWVGAAGTGAGFAMHSAGAAGALAVTTYGCVVVSPMVATVVLNRPLTYREAHILIGSCIIPVVGGWLVNEAYNNGWLWAPDEKPVRVAAHSKSKVAAAKPAQQTAAGKPAQKTTAARPAAKIAAVMPVDSMIAAH